MIPTIRNCQGSNPNDGGLCLEVNFNDGGPNEKAFLNRIDNCVYSGSFEKLDVAIAATSEECPIEETSTMQVSRPKIFQKDENYGHSRVFHIGILGTLVELGRI